MGDEGRRQTVLRVRPDEADQGDDEAHRSGCVEGDHKRGGVRLRQRRAARARGSAEARCFACRASGFSRVYLQSHVPERISKSLLANKRHFTVSLIEPRLSLTPAEHALFSRADAPPET